MSTFMRIGVAGILAAAAGAGAEPTFRTVVLSGQQAPGLPAGVVFASFADARINTQGRVAFWAELAGPGTAASNNASIWTDRGGTLALAHRLGDSAPFGSNLVWGSLPMPAFNAAGRLAFTASIVDPATPGPVNLGIFTSDVGAGTTFVVAREGFQAAGLPAGVNWANLGVGNLAADGSAAFNGNYGGAIWRGAPTAGEPALVARSGTAAPGAPGGLLFSFLDQPSAAADGTLVFRSSLTDGTPTSAVSSGLWAAAGGAVTPVVVGGIQAPGMPAGAVIAEVGLQPAVAGTGAGARTAFWARVTGAGIGTGSDEGIYAGPPGAPALIAREGSIAPGTTELWGPMARHPAVSASGAVAFWGHLPWAASSANRGIWMAAAGGPVMLVAREGDQAPRLPAGVVFAGFGEPTLNDAGQIAFMARLSGPGVTPATNSVLYAADRAGRLYPLVRTGDLFDVGAGPARIVDEVVFDSPGAEGGHSQWAGVGTGPAAAGELVMKLVFRDPNLPPSQALSSGVFAARIRCLPDLSGNGSITAEDYMLFTNAFAAEDLRRCDYSGNGLLDITDFIFFMNAAAVGCP